MWAEWHQEWEVGVLDLILKIEVTGKKVGP